MRCILLITVSLCLMPLLSASGEWLPKPGSKPFANRTVAGWVEYVTVPKLDSQFKAKLDTGATTTSLNARVLSIKKPGQDGNTGKRSLVVFEITDDEGNKRVLERRLVRWVRIRSARDDELNQRRPVVKMLFCLAGTATEEEVNLADRSDLIYPILIGRNMLTRKQILVDSSVTFKTKPDCPERDEDDGDKKKNKD